MITAEQHFSRAWGQYVNGETAKGTLGVPPYAKWNVNGLRDLTGFDRRIMAHCRLNHGRWIVNCPFCASAELAWSEGPFLCHECGNASAGGKLIEALWPPNREAIEKLVGARPRINQNWEPGESEEMLEADNISHGVGHGLDSA